MIDLKKFCATSDDPREYIRTPFRSPEGIVATNGHIMICIDDDGGEYQDAVENTKSYAAKFKAYIKDQKRAWIDAASVTLPEAKPCLACDGKGYVHEEDCDDCDGEGEFQHGSHWYDCKECNGNGKVLAGAGSGSKTTCYKCDGYGEEFQPVRVNHTAFQRKYLALIACLPDCRLGLPAEPLETTVFTFTGGWGSIMPVRN